MVAPLVIAGVKLASAFVPQILGMFSDKDSSKTVEAVMSAAQIITGTKDEDEALKILSSDPEKALEFQKALLDDKHIADRMQYADRSNAREMYMGKNEQQDLVAKNIMRWNLLAVILLLAGQGTAMIFLEGKAELMALIGNAVGYVTNSLLKERQDVISFFFSSSLGSRIKDAIKR